MSRHVFTSTTGETWTVGFDPAIASYFAQKESDTGDGDDDPIDIAGTAVGELGTVDELQHILDGQVLIPEPIVAALVNDGPTRRQWLRAADLARDRIAAAEHAIHHTTTTTEQ